MRRIIAIALLVSGSTAWSEESPATLTWFQAVTEAPGHHAFTDLAWFDGNYYLCYRSGTGHVSLDGDIRIRRSADMKSWEDCGLVKTPDDDRDPHFVVANDRLYLYFGVWDTLPGEGDGGPVRNKVRSHMTSSRDGTEWEPVQPVYESGWWLWRVRHFDGAFHSAAYTALRPVPEYRETLYLRSEDGVQWNLVSTVNQEFMAGEADLWRRDKESIAILSRTGGNGHARFFSSDASYIAWDNVELSAMVHSPVVAFYFDQIFVAGRGADGEKHVTKLWELQGTTLTELLTLPSGGDNAYPGLLTIPDSLREDHPRFFISWYSQTNATTGEKEPDGGANVYVGEISLAPVSGE